MGQCWNVRPDAALAHEKLVCPIDPGRLKGDASLRSRERAVSEVTTAGGRRWQETRRAKFGYVVGETAPPKTDWPMVCSHPYVSVVLGYVGDIGESGRPGIPFERVTFDDVPEATRPFHAYFGVPPCPNASPFSN